MIQSEGLRYLTAIVRYSLVVWGAVLIAYIAWQNILEDGFRGLLIVFLITFLPGTALFTLRDYTRLVQLEEVDPR